MSFSVEQAFVGRDEKRAPLKRLRGRLVKTWPAPNAWVCIAQLVEHCSANAKAMGSSPVEILKFFPGLFAIA